MLHIDFQKDFHEKLKNGYTKQELEISRIHFLLEEMKLGHLTLSHHENGAPFFVNQPELHISISHSNGWVAILVDDKPVGIDIQTYSKNLKAGQDYFRNSQEQQFSEDDTALHLIWGAKEAFYKLNHGKIADLKEEVSIIHIGIETIELMYGDQKSTLSYNLLNEENVFLVYSR